MYVLCTSYSEKHFVIYVFKLMLFIIKKNLEKMARKMFAPRNVQFFCESN